MKIAVISDIHGNMEALNSVLDDINKENCSKIFCLGDLSMAGPEPVLAIQKIKDLQIELGDDFALVQGNTDEMLSVYSDLTLTALKNTNEIMENAYVADSKILTADDKSFLSSLPSSKEIELFGIKILLVHGSPRKNNENIMPNLPIVKVEEMMNGVESNIIFCGHTHLPCGYQTNENQTVVNVGSVGRPFSEIPESCYAILDIDEVNSTYSIMHKFVKYDYKSAGEKLIKRGFEGAEKLAKMLESATSRYPE